MDEYDTPIEQLRPDLQQEQQPPVNYADMMHSMESSQNINSAPSNEYPPHPNIQPSKQYNYPANQRVNSEEVVKDNTYQRDFLYILIPSMILYSLPAQNQLSTLLPSLFSDRKPTFVGHALNASIIALLFIILRNMKIKFN